MQREFTEKHEVHRYLLEMQAGERIHLRIVPTGDTLLVRAFIYEPGGVMIVESDYGKEVNRTTGRLSARGDHTIIVQNMSYEGSNDSRLGFYELFLGCVHSDGTKTEAGGAMPGAAPGSPVAEGVSQLGEVASSSPDLGSFGEETAKIQGYTEEATETLHGAAKAVEAVKGLFRAFKGNGKKQQQKGQAAPPRPVYAKAAGTGPAPTPVYAQPLRPPQTGNPHGTLRTGNGAPSGHGAPAGTAGGSRAGLQPADLAGQIFPRLGLGMPLEGEVAPGGEIAGCRFLAEAGEQLELSFERLAGEQDLTLIVVDPFGELAFETRLLGSPRVATVLDLPTRGEYTVGVAATGSSGSGAARFKVDLAAAQ